MKKIYLLTSKETGYQYGDDLWIEGVFSTYEKAQKYADSIVSSNEYTVTSMTIDEPNSDGEEYPFASYIE